VEAISTIKRIDGIKTHNLQSVETSLLISVLSRLSELKLTYDGNLSQAQLHLLFTAIIEKKPQVEKLTIAGNMISKLSSFLFASTVSNVDKLKLLYCNENQMKALFMEISENKKPLTQLDISWCCNCWNIDKDLVSKALNSVEQLTEILLKLVKGERRLKRLVVEDQFQNTVNTFVIEHFSNNNYDMIEHK
jgi:hypothetical protein